MSNKNLFMKFGFPRAPLNNGIGRYVCQLQRVTLKFCKNHGGSRGVREFLEHDLLDYAKENPGVVVYVKPRRHRSPIINAEYLNGTNHWISCHNLTREEIVKWMELVRTQASDGSAVRLRKKFHTEFPSIQGPWTPFTFKDPVENIIQFPDKKLGAYLRREPTATEQLIQIFKEQQESKDEKEKIQISCE
ncbi:39S ribosomal protein L43, mitochondrial [Orussus abietinus]|uniref:39S ribosomal protein L43, mitochondrial n=1 Tax=Orussus abietinus TaxID=222816 RepID=UPI0006269288|nr:39S ribosomal protein L43, mitochondrial [Orussus abietinus]